MVGLMATEKLRELVLVGHRLRRGREEMTRGLASLPRTTNHKTSTSPTLPVFSRLCVCVCGGAEAKGLCLSAASLSLLAELDGAVDILPSTPT